MPSTAINVWDRQNTHDVFMSNDRRVIVVRPDIAASALPQEANFYLFSVDSLHLELDNIYVHVLIIE